MSNQEFEPKETDMEQHPVHPWCKRTKHEHALPAVGQTRGFCLTCTFQPVTTKPSPCLDRESNTMLIIYMKSFVRLSLQFWAYCWDQNHPRPGRLIPTQSLIVSSLCSVSLSLSRTIPFACSQRNAVCVWWHDSSKGTQKARGAFRAPLLTIKAQEFQVCFSKKVKKKQNKKTPQKIYVIKICKSLKILNVWFLIFLCVIY